MIRLLLSFTLLLALLSFTVSASAQSRPSVSMMGYGWGAAGNTTGTVQPSSNSQFTLPMWGLLSAQAGQTGQTGTATTGTPATTASDFWSLMPMFQYLGF